MLEIEKRGKQKSKLVTPRITLLFKKLLVPHLVKTLPSFYGIRRIITLVTTAHTLSLLRVSKLIHSTTFHSISLRYILIWYPIYAWVFQVVFFLRVFRTKIVYALVFPPPPHVTHVTKGLNREIHQRHKNVFIIIMCNSIAESCLLKYVFFCSDRDLCILEDL
jgi:hypothetical protein